MALTEERRNALLETLRTAAGLSDDDRAALTALVNNRPHYGLMWEDKPEDVEERLRDHLPVLDEVKERAIVSDNPDAPDHILIEGDNLEALNVLAYTHAGKIDVIYIDPPYNTGNKDFVYNDRYVDSEDSYRHSKWLSFMSKRLRIAKRLLSDSGVIFISIDDRECSNLKLLCDEVFGFQLFITLIPRVTKLQRAAQEKHMDISHDYILCYSKGEDFKHIIEREIDETRIRKNHIGTYLVNDTKAILADKSKGYSIGGDYDFEYNGTVYKPIDKNGNRNRWLWTKPRMEAAARLGILVETGSTLRMQLFLDAKFDDKTNTMVPRDTSLILHSVDFMTDSKMTNATGSMELKEIGQDLFEKFNNTKPIALISNLVKLFDNKSPTVLDFFAGSGTTLHAVMALNAEDGGHRQCILVTNNENGICERVTYERNKRVIAGYTKPNGQPVEGLHANNLRYYRTRLLPRGGSHAHHEHLAQAATDLLCIKEGQYHECPVTVEGRTLLPTAARRFTGRAGEMIVIYRPEAVKHVVAFLAEGRAASQVKVYVFCDGGYAYDDDFAPVADRVTLTAIPDAILQVYNATLPPPRRQALVEATAETETAEPVDVDYSYV